MAIVDFLQCRNGRDGSGYLGPLDAEAVAKNQLLIFLLHVQNLENPRAGLFYDFMAVAACGGIFGNHAGFGSLDLVQALSKALQEHLSAFHQRGVGSVLTLLQESIFLESELVELLAKLQMGLKRVGRTHVGGVATEVVAITASLGEPEV